MNKSLLNKNLESRIFGKVCLILAIVAFISLVLDLLFTPVPLFLFVDVAVFTILSIFFYLVNYRVALKHLIYPFIVFMIIMINLSWSVSGQGIGVGYIYFFILIIFLIITKGAQRTWIAGIVVVNVLVLTIIQALYPEFGNYSVPDEADENLAAGIGLAALLGLTSYVIGYLKRSYEKERETVSNANHQLAEKNHEIEAQNEEMKQFQDQIVAQRDEIERHLLELKEANEQIKDANHGLEKIVKERTSELDELFYRGSHDFRQPLTTLMGLSHLAKVTVKEKNATELFEKVDFTTCKMDQMLNKFLMTYEINHFDERESERCSFGEIVSDIKSDLIKEEDVVNISVKKEVKRYSLNDPRNYLLKFILFNLVDNAINFRRGEEVNILIQLSDTEHRLNLTIQDDGQGIPSDRLSRIFDMFSRGNENSTGSGMGLYVVRKATEKLGGTITCESEVEKFSKFHLSFPLVN